MLDDKSFFLLLGRCSLGLGDEESREAGVWQTGLRNNGPFIIGLLGLREIKVLLYFETV